jgi:hypothetical protein
MSGGSANELNKSYLILSVTKRLPTLRSEGQRLLPVEERIAPCYPVSAGESVSQSLLCYTGQDEAGHELISPGSMQYSQKNRDFSQAPPANLVIDGDAEWG